MVVPDSSRRCASRRLAALIGPITSDSVVLIDCLTLWASNLLLGEQDVAAAVSELTSAIGAAPGKIIFVTNEVGLGIVPDNALARRFRDIAGDINQAVAACVDSAIFVAAGLPMVLK